MEVYFIRHGETEHNRKHLHQPDDAPLNERGKRQAKETEKLVFMLDPTYMVSSTFTRASETAEIINERLLLAIERSDLFVELRRPAHLFDKHHFSPSSIWYMLRWLFLKNEHHWQHSQGESRTEFLSRIRGAKQYLESLPKDARVVVVTHSHFISYFVEHVCAGRQVPFWKAALLLLKLKKYDNLSVTHVRYNSATQDQASKWTHVRFDRDEHTNT